MRTYVCDRCKQVIDKNNMFYSIEAKPYVIINFDYAERNESKSVIYKHLCEPCFINIFGEETK